MYDLINRQDAINLLKKWSDGYSYIEVETESAIKEFQHLPSAQPERKRGKWLPYEFGSERWHKCSACGKADEYINERGLEAVRKFCPNCGAEMEE